MDADKLVDAAYNGTYISYLRKGSLGDDDVNVAFKEIIRRAAGEYFEENPEERVVSVRQLKLPRPESAFDILSLLDVVVEDGGYRVIGEDYNVNVSIPFADERVGDIPDADINIDVPTPALPNAILSDSLLEETNAGIAKAFEADRTRGVDIKYEMDVPDQVKQDPYGADFTTGRMRDKDE